MSTESIREGFEPVIPDSTAEATLRRTACWPRALLLTAGLVGLLLAQGIAGWARDPSDGAVKLVTAAVVIVALGAIGLTISRILTLVECRWRQVFRSSRILACAAVLSVVTALLIGALFVVLDPFRDVVASGHISAGDIADAGWVIAVIVCWVGAVTALLGAWDAHREERDWTDSLQIGSGPSRVR